MPGIPSPSNFTYRYPQNPDGSKVTGDEKFFNLPQQEDPRRTAILQMRGIANQVPPSPAASPSPVDTGPSAYDQYQQMIAQFNPDRMASDQFGPQYAMLDRLNADAQKRYGANSQSMGDMYGALQASIRGDAAGISNNYDSAGRALNQNYADTQNEVTGYQDASRNKTAELMKNLGIQAAAPVGIGRMNESGDRWNKLMATQNLANTDANTQRKASSLNYNNTMGERAGFEGAAQKGGLLNGFNDFLNQNAMKRLGIQGEQSGVASGYKMKLMDMYSQMASQRGSNEASAMKAAQDQSNWEQTFRQKQLTDASLINKASQGQMTPYEKLAQTAHGYGNIWGPTDQAGIAKAIVNQYQDAYQQKDFMDPNKSQSLNGTEFIRQLMQANPHIEQQQAFQDMATQFFNNMYKK